MRATASFVKQEKGDVLGWGGGGLGEVGGDNKGLVFTGYDTIAKIFVNSHKSNQS